MGAASSRARRRGRKASQSVAPQQEPASLPHAAAAFAGALAGAPAGWSDCRTFDGEPERLAATQACYEGAPPASDARFAPICKLMATIFRTPISLVSLIDDEQLHFVAHGEAEWPPAAPRRASFCTAVLVPPAAEVLVVEDALRDERFRANAYVAGPPGIRFYAGAPLVGSGGHRYGTLCVIDTRPRRFPAELYNTLVNFAELVVRELEAERRSGPPLGLLRSAQSRREAVLLLDCGAGDGWPVLYANDAWGAATGVAAEGRGFWALFSAAGGDEEEAAVRLVMQNDCPAALRVVPRAAAGAAAAGRALSLLMRPSAADALEPAVPVGIPGFVAPPTVRASPSRPRMSVESAASDASAGARRYWFAVLQPAAEAAAPGGVAAANQAAALAALALPGSDAPQRFGVVVPPRLQGLMLGPLLGSGSSGRVYRAAWRGQLVAVKVMETVGDGSASARGLLEAALGAGLSHPNLARTLDYTAVAQPVAGDADAVCHTVWIVLEYCDRGRLYDAVERGWLWASGGTQRLLAILGVAAQVAAAMRYLHARDILHGDLTGNNVLLATAPGGGLRAVVSDFGLARVARGAVNTDTFGTVTHMPPELLADGLLTSAADVWAYGVLVWEMWSGVRAWAGRRAVHVMHVVSTGKQRLELPGDAPPALRALVGRCLSYDASARPGFEEVSAEVEGMLSAAKAAGA